MDFETPVPSTWPPTQPSPAAVWPPAPTARPIAAVPFKNVQLRTVGYISDFRTGEIGIHADGVSITGKAVRPSEQQYWILVGVFIVRLWLIAVVLMEAVR